MRKQVRWIVMLISVVLLAIGFAIDVFPSVRLSFPFRILFYGLPILLLFIEMCYEMRQEKEETEKQRIKKKRLTFIFILYIIILATMLFFSSTYRLPAGHKKEAMPLFSIENVQRNTNFIPFAGIGKLIEKFSHHTIGISVIVVNLVGNILIFAPFGYFLPVLYQNRIKKAWQFVLLMSIIVILVEAIQFITRVGQADVDDLILNVLGATIVYLGVRKHRMKKEVSRIVEK